MGRTDSRSSGVTRSPWDPALTPGGSSGGASASVAAGITTLAIGTDMGGSTRLPASYTGLVGMRPSTGRIARRFGFPATAIDFQVIGPFARTMRDMRLLYRALAGPDPRDPYSLRFPPVPDVTPDRRLRIGWFTAIGDEGATPEVAASVAAAVGGLAGANCQVTPVSAPFNLGALRAFHAVLTSAAAARVVVRFPDRWRAETCENVRTAAERGLAISAAAYVDALDALATWRADLTAAWGDTRVDRPHRRRAGMAGRGRSAARSHTRDAGDVWRLGERRRAARHERSRPTASRHAADRRADRRTVRA